MVFDGFALFCSISGGFALVLDGSNRFLMDYGDHGCMIALTKGMIRKIADKYLNRCRIKLCDGGGRLTFLNRFLALVELAIEVLVKLPAKLSVESVVKPVAEVLCELLVELLIELCSSCVRAVLEQCSSCVGEML